MITYELAKQLKDAGFPQKEITPSHVREAMDYEQDEVVTFPTLSELVEACGDRFHELHHCNKGNDPKKWWAYSYNLAETGEGFTPEEAVAKLWLELNKK